MKNTKELINMTADELQEHLEDAKKELFSMRLQRVSGQLDNPLRIRFVRRSIARIKTIMNQVAKAEG